MPLLRYVLRNPDTVLAIEFTGNNADELFAAFPDNLFCDDGNTPWFYADENGNSETVKPGMVVLQFHDSSLMAMTKHDFDIAYERSPDQD